MNTRFIVTSKAWFGGGGDLTPIFPDESAGAAFMGHASACDLHDPDYYPRFKKWCDEYFYLPHREEPRGAGGISTTIWTVAAGRPTLLSHAMSAPPFTRLRRDCAGTDGSAPSEADRHHQLVRAASVEFNLL